MSSVAHPLSSSKFPVPLRLHDPIHVGCWAEDLACQVYDLLSAARDATERKRDRALSRAAARDKIDESAEAIDQLLFALRCGLAEARPAAESASAPTPPSTQPAEGR